jgi:hypothetical protein
VTPLAFCCGSAIGKSHNDLESPNTCKKFSYAPML